MKTKQQLAKVILANAEAEAKELLQHANGVAEFVLKNFPDEVPDRFVYGERKSTESALLGRYRKPDETGRLMLQRLQQMLEDKSRQ